MSRIGRISCAAAAHDGFDIFDLITALFAIDVAFDILSHGDCDHIVDVVIGLPDIFIFVCVRCGRLRRLPGHRVAPGIQVLQR